MRATVTLQVRWEDNSYMTNDDSTLGYIFEKKGKWYHSFGNQRQPFETRMKARKDLRKKLKVRP